MIDALRVQPPKGSASGGFLHRIKNLRSRGECCEQPYIANRGRSRDLDFPLSDAREAVQAYLKLAGIQVLSVPPTASDAALGAYDRYGKDRHLAALNLGDCSSYAFARYYRAPMLYTGEDSPHAGIEAA